jgi:hypothetical protein
MYIFHSYRIHTSTHLSHYTISETGAGALTLRPPTNRPHDILTRTKHTEHSDHCDNLLLWQFHPVTFYILLRHFIPYCTWYVQVSNVHPPPCWTFIHCVSKFTFFIWIVTGHPLLLWSECGRFVIRAHLEVFWLVWQEWTKVRNGQDQGLMMRHTDTWISLRML